VLLLLVVLLCKVLRPTAVLPHPTVFDCKANAPMAVLYDAILLNKALLPTAVLPVPVVLALKALEPKAVLYLPVVLLTSAL
jgi:hypothetical protein